MKTLLMLLILASFQYARAENTPCVNAINHQNALRQQVVAWQEFEAGGGCQEDLSCYQEIVDEWTALAKETAALRDRIVELDRRCGTDVIGIHKDQLQPYIDRFLARAKALVVGRVAARSER